MTDKKRDEADKRNAFWIGLRFEHQGNRIGARGRPASLIGALDDNHKISHQARRMGVDFIGNSWFQNSNLYHRRMMQVHGLPLFVENIDGYEKYPIFSMKTVLAQRDDDTPIAPGDLSVGKLTKSLTQNPNDQLMLVLYLSDEDWQDVLRFNSHRFLTFKLFFSEFIQAATQASEDIRYVMEENIEKIEAEKDLGDGSARMDSYQTLLDFGIWHSGDLLKHPIYCWAKFGGYEV